MFPDNTLREEIQVYQNSLKVQSTKLGLTTSLNFEKSQIILSNGSPKLITDIEAIQQWIILFVTTPRDTLHIYKGTNFGTSYRKLLGRKVLNNGYEEAELEREITEGLPLNPAIKSVTNVKLSKEGKYLNVDVQVQLQDDQLLDTFIEKAYIFK